MTRAKELADTFFYAMTGPSQPPLERGEKEAMRAGLDFLVHVADTLDEAARNLGRLADSAERIAGKGAASNPTEGM